MSPRHRKARRLLSPPPVKGFRPFGPEVSETAKPPVYLLFEEYEAIRLSDYDGLNHHQASVWMHISRPTFTRIYASALRKIAEAFVEGRQISIEGGKVFYDSSWYHCQSCQCYFNNPDKEHIITSCALCGSTEIGRYTGNNPHIQEQELFDVCVCPACHHEQPHEKGHPCNQTECPKCGQRMTRKHKNIPLEP